MEFVLLIFINIIMGTIFYLILRLRLEKHASDYKEKRLKREIDEIISIFNETAERNITILENRIDYLKKLLEKSGTIANIDLKIGDLKYNNQDIEEKELKEKDLKTSNPVNTNFISNTLEIRDNEKDISKNLIVNNQDQSFGSISKYYLQIKERLNKAFKSVIIHKHGVSDLYNKNGQSLGVDDTFEKYNEIQADVSSIADHTRETNEITADDNVVSSNHDSKNDALSEMSDSKLTEMFRNSEDKYLLISELFNEGYPAELICKCSGIPIGEIKLVLDLNSRV
jgi:hypothetical protein